MVSFHNTLSVKNRSKGRFFLFLHSGGECHQRSMPMPPSPVRASYAAAGNAPRVFELRMTSVTEFEIPPPRSFGVQAFGALLFPFALSTGLREGESTIAQLNEDTSSLPATRSVIIQSNWVMSGRGRRNGEAAPACGLKHRCVLTFLLLFWSKQKSKNTVLRKQEKSKNKSMQSRITCSIVVEQESFNPPIL